ncbi:MAG: hypothetical protein ACYCX4_17285 [Bacillota bacterium]
MTHKFDQKHAGRLDEPERKKILDPLHVLAPLNLAPGMHVADVGCGSRSVSEVGIYHYAVLLEKLT